jgi:leucyl/phenylalanyl-tRNA--protein transferase
MQLPWLEKNDPFPPATQAFSHPNGLLAAGADLSPARLLDAYQHGIYPWYSEGEPILWWSPTPRCVLYPAQFKCSRSLGKRDRSGAFHVTSNTAFTEVIDACGNTRDDTWITEAMREAYYRLHQLGWAHSVEVWQHGQLVGGLYGLAIGKLFFGESMFSRVTDASKIAALHLSRALAELDFHMIDCQMETEHLLSLGAVCIERETFEKALCYTTPAIPLAADTLATYLRQTCAKK